MKTLFLSAVCFSMFHGIFTETTQAPSSAPDLSASQLAVTLAQMSWKEKAQFLADYLYNNQDVFQSLENILLAALPIAAMEPAETGIFANAILPWALNALPGLLQNPEFLGVAGIFIKEVNAMPITSDFFLHSGNRTLDMNYFAKKLFSKLSCNHMMQEGMALKAAAAAAAMATGGQPTTAPPPSGPVCYKDTMGYLARLVMGIPMAVGDHSPDKDTQLVG